MMAIPVMISIYQLRISLEEITISNMIYESIRVNVLLLVSRTYAIFLSLIRRNNYLLKGPDPRYFVYFFLKHILDINSM